MSEPQEDDLPVIVHRPVARHADAVTETALDPDLPIIDLMARRRRRTS